MSAYLVIKAKVTDPVRFAPYAEQSAPLLARFGGSYVVRGGQQELLEGPDDGMRVVVARFADRDAALAYWHSPEYTACKALREGTGQFEVRLVEGEA
ncbi:hypothetical protein ABB30_00105 [Stenotrophomonas ginsengisoli]|uniref:DUF1330 domain-containing protein n=1 Tax=Stenotrophomonas ginsengisoli TaxID=336566 RepID=A0A0R0DN17_9GAMM|nr:DUF1330 domain-containing protein [Stenotrophomonas ginsengisoli]KRG79713.1 hypothetical protein ABB30_00105 [Stenotrophomonas ginsengisoli]